MLASPIKMNVWIFVTVSAVCLQVAFTQCPTGWLLINTSSIPAQTCYRIYTTPLDNFDGAAAYCHSQGGYLARDTSQIVHNALKPNIIAAVRASQSNRFWFGLTDNNTNYQWLWYGGSTIGTYTDFASSSYGTYNVRDCGYIYCGSYSTDFSWYYTSSCSLLYPFICQMDYKPPTVAPSTLKPLNCPAGWSPYRPQGSCIKLYSNPVSWSSARTMCSQAGADLIKINTTDLNNFVGNLINANKGAYWIGLNDQRSEGFYQWLDVNIRLTPQTNFTNWDSKMPNNSAGNENCVITDAFKNNKWDDVDCSKLNRFICQRIPSAGSPTSGPSTTNCGPGWDEVIGSDTCLSFNLNVLTWQDAQTQCKSKGGDLASIANLQEQSYLSARTFSLNANLFWVGANDRATENGWQWTDGTPFAFLNWDDRQPDNSQDSDCTVMSKQNGRWNDVPCASRNPYICKKKGLVTMPSQVTTTTEPAHLPGDVFYGCPRGWENYRGSCYKMVQLAVGVDWATASDSCTSPSLQGALAAIIDAEENRFILSLVPTGYRDSIWIGLEDPQENTFTWVDDTPVQYTNWNPGEPNNMNNEDCVAMRGDNGKWNDAQCTNTYTVYVCKKSKSILPRTGSDEEQGCTNGSIGYGAQCYTYVTPLKNYNDAQKDCKARSQNLGNLATVDSGHLQAFLAAELYTSPGNTYWIGLQQNNDVYKWQSNTPVAFTYWGKNHTGNERWTCVAMQHNGLWANYPCSQMNMSYICESPRPGFTTPTTRATVTRLLPCPAGWGTFGLLCYKVFYMNISNQLSWGEARDYCSRQANGGSLVTISDNATQSWLYTNLMVAGNKTSGHFWIGLNDRDSESGYVWLNDVPFMYSNWAPNQPNDELNKEDCVEWILPDNNWNDDYCAVSKSWICQVPRGSVITTPKPTPTGVASPLCPNSSWILSNNYCYFVSSPDGGISSATWFDSRQVCINMGADLASIRGDDENSFITSVISKSPVNSFWIGLNELDQETYGWSDLSPVNYVNWALNEPDDNYGGEDCVEILSDGSWNDYQCQTDMGYICKMLAGGSTVTPFVPGPATGGCPRDFVSLPSLSYCYHVGGTTNSTRKSFADAIQECEHSVHKAKLASIHSSLEENMFQKLLKDSIHKSSSVDVHSLLGKVVEGNIAVWKGQNVSLRRLNLKQFTVTKTVLVEFKQSKVVSIRTLNKVQLQLKCVKLCHLNLPGKSFRVALLERMAKSLHTDSFKVRNLNHSNLARIFGACLEDSLKCLVTECCIKGSLQDLLGNMSITLDAQFKSSLCRDIIDGLCYIHQSPIHKHGRLNSNVCLIDNRFSVKLTDFGLPTLYRNVLVDVTSEEYKNECKWKAPEILRSGATAIGTVEGDIYSYGMILLEIITQVPLFAAETDYMTTDDIIEKVQDGGDPPFRPAMEFPGTFSTLTELIQNCWAESPKCRPSCQSVKASIKRMSTSLGDSGNLMENLMRRMELYANNLEKMVEEKTGELREEKKKSEELLYQILPRSVADKLKLGLQVAPEVYDGVTIYFSDIVGFTEISAISSPMQIVDLLNDIYSCFDAIIEEFDVYKVETIGDAYMVVSGLPQRNGNLHALNIARMSIKVLETIREFKIRHIPTESVQIRIGLNSGSVCAGVVGSKMPRYCLFGDTVNTASRMESSGKAMMIHISPSTKALLHELGSFHIIPRGNINVKGKGQMFTYWLMTSQSETTDQLVD